MAQHDKLVAEEKHDDKAARAAKDQLEALLLFKNDNGAYVRLCSFLSQIFDYGNTDIEKRFFFYKRRIPLLDYGRERDTADLSKVVLTHHTLKSFGKTPMEMNADGGYKLTPMDAVGGSSVQEKQPTDLNEIIEKMNGLFEEDLSDDDQFVMEALGANQTMSTQALGSERVREGLPDILLGPAQL